MEWFICFLRFRIENEQQLKSSPPKVIVALFGSDLNEIQKKVCNKLLGILKKIKFVHFQKKSLRELFEI